LGFSTNIQKYAIFHLTVKLINISVLIWKASKLDPSLLQAERDDGLLPFVKRGLTGPSALAFGGASG